MKIIRKAEDRGDAYHGYQSNDPSPKRNPLKTTPKVSRRQVFPTGEIPHKWAHATQEAARNPQGNLYFRGDTLYSYRDSYPIAKLFRKKGATLALHVSNTYSSTTAGHCSDARSATRHLLSIIVPDVEPDNKYRHSPAQHAQNIKFLVDKAAALLAKAQRAMQVSSVGWRRRDAEAALTDAETYSRFFGIRRKVPAFPELAWNAAAARAERIENPDPVRDAKRFKLREQRAKAAGEVQEYREAMESSMLAAGRQYLGYRATHGNRWQKTLARFIGREGTPFYHDMANRSAWRLGLTSGHSDPIMLRVNGEQIETSQGARIPLAAAPIVWGLVKRSVAQGGREFDKGLANGRYKVGDYPLDRIDADGTLHAGCHSIPHSELRSMARQLGIAS